jgi:YidC/Oxa1 family membrane protein insertase
MTTPKERGSQPAQGGAPELSASMSKDMLKFLGILVVIGIVVWQWSLFVAIFGNILLWIYSLLETVPGAFGWSIILFTVLIRLATWPLNQQQMKSMKAMQEMQSSKEWKAVQKKYEKEPEKKNVELMKLQQERGISPFGGCLPLLIQMPILIAVYQSVSRALALTPLSLLDLTRNVNAAILDVSKIIPLDSKFLWFDLGLPEYILIGTFHFPLLAIIVGVTTYIQTKLTTPSNPDPNDQAASMNRSMSITMPLMLFWFALSFPSGVAVYILTGNILAVIQYALMGKANWRNLLPGGNKPAPQK